ncbi:hypothetical protein ACS0TY_026317 [Phlomoides rotata]
MDTDKLFVKENESEQLLMLKRLRERSRGRLKGKRQEKDKSTKREKSAFEYVGSIVDSCSQATIEFGGPVHGTPMFNNAKGKNQEIRRKVIPPCTVEFIDLLPIWIRGYILGTSNVLGDGHCGFRAVAEQMGFGEEEWGKVRCVLIKELTLHRDLYSKVFILDGMVDDVMKRLNNFNTFGPKYHWFMLP